MKTIAPARQVGQGQFGGGLAEHGFLINSWTHADAKQRFPPAGGCRAPPGGVADISPKQFYVVALQRLVAADQTHIFRLRLGHQHTVEGVAMVFRQLSGSQAVLK